MNISLISQLLISILVFLVPLFLTTKTGEFYSTSKFALLLLVIPLLLVFWVITWIKGKKVVIKLNRFNLPVLVFAAVNIISLIVGSPNKIASLVNPSGTGLIIALSILYFLITNLVTKKEQITLPAIASGLVLSLLFIAQFTGLAEKLPFEILKNKYWTPVGLLFTLPIVLGLLIPFTIEEALSATRNTLRTLLGWIATIILGTGLILSLIALTDKDGRPVLPSYNTSWTVAVDSLKNIKTAFFGVGAGNYVDAFTQSKPLSINSSDFWALRFEVATSYLLQLITETGMLGFIAYLIIIANLLKFRKNPKNATFISLLILFISQLFLPATTLTLFFVFVLLGLFALKEKTGVFEEQSYIFPRVAIIVVVLLLVTTYWFGSRWYLGEVYFKDSLVFASQNKGLETYNTQIKAVQINPYLDTYHVSLSQTNLALAGSLAQKGNLTDADRQNITLLIQQAIAEGKLATSLNPNRASNWDNLAYIYRNLLNAASGADNWTITAYNQAIKLDPLNPVLRVSIGGVFYSLKNYDAAIQQFTIAVNLKQDWANAHYNLSAALREKGDYQNAFTEMQNTIALVDPKSNDFGKATAELEELRKKLPVPLKTGSTANPETLTEPQGKTVEVKPKIELPKEEVAPVVPAESVTPSVEPTETSPTPKAQSTKQQPTPNP